MNLKAPQSTGAPKCCGAGNGWPVCSNQIWLPHNFSTIYGPWLYYIGRLKIEFRALVRPAGMSPEWISACSGWSVAFGPTQPGLRFGLMTVTDKG